MTSPRLDGGSFRDRQGRVFYHSDTVYRALSEDAWQAWKQLEASTFFTRAQDDGSIVATRAVDVDADPVNGDSGLDRATLEALSPHWVGALRHARIPFVSYPYEWCFGMLRDAARLQLRLITEALGDDLIPKDATSYNVQWRGARPTFIDIASFEPWRRGAPWVGYLQFCQLFLYPLLLTAYRDIDFQPLLRGRVDGVSPETISRILNRLRDRLRPGVFADVYLQAKLQARAASRDTATQKKELARAGFSKSMILGNVARLSKIVEGLTWKRATSTWAGYARDNSYDRETHDEKARFVEQVAEAERPRLTIDLGCNTGVFSALVAPHSETVVAVDGDHLAIEHLYRRLREDGPDNVLPLVVDLTDPSPALGWRQRERTPLDARGTPELVLCLALVHHMVITANVPLDDVIDWLADLGGALVIEWVDKRDAMVERLLRNKDDIYVDYTPEAFEGALARRYEIVRRQVYHGGTRTLVHARPRPS